MVNRQEASNWLMRGFTCGIASLAGYELGHNPQIFPLETLSQYIFSRKVDPAAKHLISRAVMEVQSRKRRSRSIRTCHEAGW